MWDIYVQILTHFGDIMVCMVMPSVIKLKYKYKDINTD